MSQVSFQICKCFFPIFFNLLIRNRHATVFTHAVKDEIAPGYHKIVYRPMDLSTIKKNIENSTIKTTREFQRDIMLMFTNAIMYNSSNHDVHKIALEMYKEVIYNVELLNTQENLNETKPSRFKESRASTTSDRVRLFAFELILNLSMASKRTHLKPIWMWRIYLGKKIQCAIWTCYY